MQNKSYVLFVILLTLSGCGAYVDHQLSRLKEDVRAKFAKALSISLDGKIAVLPNSPDQIELTEFRVADVMLRVPSFLTETQPQDQSQRILSYDRFIVLVTVLPRDLELPANWGDSNYARYRAVYSLDDNAISAADNPDRLSHLVSGLVLKSMLVVQGADSRFTEFRSPNLKGFVIGSVDAGAHSTTYECFVQNDEHRVTTLGFSPEKGSRVTDAEIERFMSAVQISIDAAK